MIIWGTGSDVNLSNVVELDDNTDLSGELACAGGSCEIDIDLKTIEKEKQLDEA